MKNSCSFEMHYEVKKVCWGISFQVLALASILWPLIRNWLSQNSSCGFNIKHTLNTQFDKHKMPHLHFISAHVPNQTTYFSAWYKNRMFCCCFSHFVLLWCFCCTSSNFHFFFPFSALFCSFPFCPIPFHLSVSIQFYSVDLFCLILFDLFHCVLFHSSRIQYFLICSILLPSVPYCSKSSSLVCFIPSPFRFCSIAAAFPQFSYLVFPISHRVSSVWFTSAPFALVIFDTHGPLAQLFTLALLTGLNAFIPLWVWFRSQL